MLGVPIVGSLLLFGDNQSKFMSTTVPGSALETRHSAVAYHCIREAVACCIVKIINCCSKTNQSNLLTKPLGPQMFQRLVKQEQFPPRLMDEGELNGETVNGKSVTPRKHRWMEITYPESDIDLMDALANLDFMNNVIKMERESDRTRLKKMETVGTKCWRRNW